jgi:UDP-N-acetylglucosamine--N-acetylmuramyl-(pentapeptide) pyrophosphoryl-undecaprenol N-acetylglucosamine transferase
VTVRVLIAAGGTGGHVFPGLALARALAARPGVAQVTFAGTTRGIETGAVPAAGFELDLLPILPLSRRLALETVLAPFAAVAGTAAAHRLVRRRHVDVVVGMGGYVTLPTALGARLAGVPVVLHEQNAVPGIANRLAARVAARVALGVDAAAGAFPAGRTVVVGNPVRPELARLDRAGLRPEGLAAFGLDPDRRTLFVFGGSLGARRINAAVTDSAGRWPQPRQVQILHACGRRDEAMVRERWAAAVPGDLLVRVVPFVERMDLAYAVADLAVSRAGALTVAELTAAGVPSIMVPLPHATAGHQAANARVLDAAGGVVAVPDGELDGERLVEEAAPLLARPESLAAMAKVMRDLSRPEAAEQLADVVLATAPPHPTHRDGER